MSPHTLMLAIATQQGPQPSQDLGREIQQTVQQATQEAMQEIRDAQQQVRDAQQQVRDAQQGIRDAQEQLRSARTPDQRGAAQQAMFAAQQQLREAQAELRRVQSHSSTAPAQVWVGPGSDGFPAIPPQAVDVAVGFFITCAVIVVGWPISRAFGRRLERRGAPPALDAGLADQLQRIEQAVEAVAIEVERISESQRFLTRLQEKSPSTVE